MPIRTIEIICLPCNKCSQLKTIVSNVIKALELKNKKNIIYNLRVTANLQNIADYGISPAQTPVLLINGVVECAGSVDQGVVKSKLTTAHYS